MSQESEALHIKFEGASGNEVIIRHGEAEPIHTPGKLNLSGRFTAPAEFITKRTYVEEKQYFDTHVIFNEKDLSITLVVGEQDRNTITVTGALKKNPFLESLKINSSGHSNRSLLELIRHKGHLFSSRDDHRKLVVALQNFEVGTSTNIKDSNDRQGNKEVSVSEKAKSTISGMDITLNVPLFEGQEKAPIHLTVEVEPNNGTVLIFLVSETFEEFYDEAVRAQFALQRPVFEPFVIIEK